MPKQKPADWDGGDPWRNLAATVLLQALSDLNRGYSPSEALAFLEGDDAAWYTNMLQIEHEALLAAVRRVDVRRKVDDGK